jgi:hypothetical protein
MRKTAPAIFLILLSMTCFSQEISLRALLPESSAIRGWALSKEPETYTGDELFDLVDGGADLFFEYFFARVVSAAYIEPNGNKIQVEIYDMNSDSTAYGVFSSAYNSSDIRRDIGLYSVVNDQYITFVKDRYYVNIAWILTAEARPEALMSFARGVEKQIAGTSSHPSILDKLQDIPYSGIPIYFLGNIALSNVYYFDYKDPFDIEQGVAFKDDNTLKIIFLYSKKETSTAVFSNVHDFVEGSKRFSDRGMIYQGFTCYDNKGNRIVFRLGEGFIAVVVALKPEVQMMPLLDEFVNGIEVSLHK